MCSSTDCLLTSLVLNDSGSSSTSPSRLPRMLVEYQPSMPSRRALKPGARMVFISVWPVLKSLPRDRHCVLLRELQHRREVDRQVRRAVGVGDAFHQRRVGVDHRRRDRRVVRLEALLERLERLVRRRLGQVDLGGAAPDIDEPVEVVVLLEARMSARTCSARSRLFLPFLTFGPVEPLHVLAVEDGRPGLDGFKLGLICSSRSLVEHAGVLRRLVAVVLEDVPAAEHEVVEVGEGHEVLDERRAAVGALARGGWCPSG